MEYKKYLDPELIILNPDVKRKDKLLFMFSKFISSKIGISESKLYQNLLEREKLGSTGIGEGIAIPHCRLEGYNNIKIVVALSKDGIDFDAMDGGKVHLFFVIVASSKTQASYFRVLSHLSRTLQNKTIYQELIKSETKQQIYELLINC